MLMVVAGICVRDGRVLLTRRPEGKHLGGCWEFPGGKMAPGEAPAAALDREWQEELGTALTAAVPHTFGYHRYPEGEVLVLFFRVELAAAPAPQEGQDMAWVPLKALPSLEMPAADRALIETLARGELGPGFGAAEG